MGAVKVFLTVPDLAIRGVVETFIWVGLNALVECITGNSSVEGMLGLCLMHGFQLMLPGVV